MPRRRRRMSAASPGDHMSARVYIDRPLPMCPVRMISTANNALSAMMRRTNWTTSMRTARFRPDTLHLELFQSCDKRIWRATVEYNAEQERPRLFWAQKIPGGPNRIAIRSRQSVRLRRVPASALLESSPDEQTRSERQRRNGVDRCRDAYRVGENTGEKCASDIAQI